MRALVFITFAGVVLTGCQKQGAQESTQQPKSSGEASTQAMPTKASFAPKVYDGPFGLAGGLSVAELERMGFKPMSDRPDLFLGTPPKPLQDAEGYAVMATPTAGVCRILARVPVAVVNGSGDQLKEKTDRLAELMQQKYGKYSEKVDYIKQDVYRRNPEYWMLGLKEESVLYAYDWTVNKTAQPLPGELENIEISADTTELRSGTVTIKYTFKNFSACRKDMEVRKAESL